MVAMTAGDAGIMARHREEVLRALQQGVDVMFMNQCALCLWHQALRLSVWAKPSVFTVNPWMLRTHRTCLLVSLDMLEKDARNVGPC